ncbi:hypothetical protein PG997_007474 [Apiospora hydei]|uniref:Uncharacterized protein n=1 Tax=Apiospora hydei TaxID=1337664 RepID=A0ABR1WAW0_9PEZI
MEEQVEQPYIANLLTPPEAEELRAVAMSVLSLGQPTTRPIIQRETTREPLHPDGSGLPDVSDDSEESERASTDAADSSMAQELETTEQQDNTSNASANSEQIERLLQEAKLPFELQLLILWLMSLGARWPQLENRRLPPRTSAAD